MYVLICVLGGVGVGEWVVFGMCVYCVGVWKEKNEKKLFFPFCDSYLLSDVDPGVRMLT